MAENLKQELYNTFSAELALAGEKKYGRKQNAENLQYFHVNDKN